MAVKIEDLLREADALIEKRASVKTEVQLDNTEEVTKIANLLMAEDEEYEKVANAVEPKVEDFSVKIAQAMVINEILCNVDKFNKIEEFEKKASAQGFTQAQIDEFVIEKML